MNSSPKMFGQQTRIPQARPWLDDAEQQSVAQCIARSWITEGRAAQELSERLNAWIGAPYGVFAPNGTMALVLALLALGIGQGDEVLVPDATFIASANAVIMAGAKPVFVDVQPGTYHVDLARAAAHLTSRTRAIMPVHLYGTACDMAAVAAFAATHRLKVIEDAAQALGAQTGGRQAGSMGDAGCFSFFGDKTITMGEGGYVTCQDPDVYERLRLLRNQGRLERGAFVHPALGYNFRITDLQAAIGLAQMDKLGLIIARKLAVEGEYRRRLARLQQVQFLKCPPGRERVPFRVTLLAQDAHGLMDHLEASGVETRTFFYPLHRQPALSHLAGADGASYPMADHGFENGLCLPVFPTLAEEELAYICDQVAAFYAQGKPPA